MNAASPDAVEALLAQWNRIVERIPTLDLDQPTRLPGWRNREVIAHLTLLAMQAERYLGGPQPARASMSLADHLLGVASYASTLDRTAREGAVAGRTDLGRAVAVVTETFRTADRSRVVITVLGSVRLHDYAITRCLETVVHGLDLVPPVPPDPVAAELTVAALDDLLHQVHPGATRPQDDIAWIEVATGRTPPPAGLAGICPLVS